MAKKVVDVVPGETDSGQDKFGLFKEYLAEPKYRIKLDDLLNVTIRAVLHQTSDEHFSPNENVQTGEAVAARIKAYEETIRTMQSYATLFGKWSTIEQQSTLTNMMSRLSENCVKSQNDYSHLTRMRWFPLSLLTYSAGIAAISSENYAALKLIHFVRIESQTWRTGETTVPIIVPIVDAMGGMGPVWKIIPGYEKKFVPMSEYMFNILQPVLDELIYLGGSYEHLFDRYEILRALTYADQTDSGRGPVGRFGWKHHNMAGQGGPFKSMRYEAGKMKEQWGPIKAGLFGGSYTRFEQVANNYETGFLNKLDMF